MCVTKYVATDLPKCWWKTVLVPPNPNIMTSREFCAAHVCILCMLKALLRVKRALYVNSTCDKKIDLWRICSEANDKTLLSAKHRLVVWLAHFVCGRDSADVLLVVRPAHFVCGRDSADVLVDFATQTLGKCQQQQLLCGHLHIMQALLCRLMLTYLWRSTPVSRAQQSAGMNVLALGFSSANRCLAPICYLAFLLVLGTCTYQLVLRMCTFSWSLILHSARPRKKLMSTI
jgi:hypothetical protein